MPRHKPKPAPTAAALSGFYSALGIASAPWDKAVSGIVDALRAASYLKDSTQQGREEACRVVQHAIHHLIPIGGDIDGSRAHETAQVAVDALAARGALTDRAMHRLAAESDLAPKEDLTRG